MNKKNIEEGFMDTDLFKWAFLREGQGALDAFIQESVRMSGVPKGGLKGTPKKDPSETKIDPSRIKKPVYLFLGSTDRLPTEFGTVN